MYILPQFHCLCNFSDSVGELRNKINHLMHKLHYTFLDDYVTTRHATPIAQRQW